jgi:hypothetical protein
MSAISWPARWARFVLSSGLAQCLATLLFILGLLGALLAWRYPLELEMRESTVWLHAITMQAGISIYDNSQVAYVNMNHGPMDSILKFGIHCLLPGLDAWQVIRLFVLLLPCLLLAVSWALRRRLSASAFGDALLISAVFYCAMRSLAPYHLLVGRTDSTGLCLMVAGFGAARLAHRPGGELTGSMLAGLFMSAAALTTWRLAPASAFLAALALAPEPGPGYGLCLLKRLSLALALGLGLFGAVLFIQFHGNFWRYSLFFFGFFKAYCATSGGLWAKMLALGKSLPLPAILSAYCLAVLAAAWWFEMRQGRLAALAVLVLGSLAWELFAYSVNQQGGGLYYICGSLTLVWAALCCEPWAFSLLNSPKARLGILGLVLAVAAAPMALQARTLFIEHDGALAYQRELARLDASHPIYNESEFLICQSWRGQRIDSGDAVWSIMESGAYGPQFEGTAMRYFRLLALDPAPRLAYFGPASSPRLFKLIAYRGIQILSESPEHDFFNGGSTACLVRIKALKPCGPHPSRFPMAQKGTAKFF